MPNLIEFIRGVLTIIFFVIFMQLLSPSDKNNKKSEKNKQDQKPDAH